MTDVHLQLIYWRLAYNCTVRAPVPIVLVEGGQCLAEVCFMLSYMCTDLRFGLVVREICPLQNNSNVVVSIILNVVHMFCYVFM